MDNDTRWSKEVAADTIAYWKNSRQPIIELPLNAYQAANLLRLLQLVWAGKIQVPNNGDWAGELPQLLMAIMRLQGGEFSDSKANDSVSPFEDPRG